MVLILLSVRVVLLCFVPGGMWNLIVSVPDHVTFILLFIEWLTKCNISRSVNQLGWLVGCFGLNEPLRHYNFSLYRAVSQREVERKETIDE